MEARRETVTLFGSHVRHTIERQRAGAAGTTPFCKWETVNRRGSARGDDLAAIKLSILGICADVDAPSITLLALLFEGQRIASVTLANHDVSLNVSLHNLKNVEEVSWHNVSISEQ